MGQRIFFLGGGSQIFWKGTAVGGLPKFLTEEEEGYYFFFLHLLKKESFFFFLIFFIKEDHPNYSMLEESLVC